MSRTYTISPDPFLVVIKDEEGNSYSCNHLDMIELDGYRVHVPGIYDWYLYFNTYAEWTKYCMDKRFKGRIFHRRDKAAEMPRQTTEDLQLTLPLHQIPI